MYIAQLTGEKLEDPIEQKKKQSQDILRNKVRMAKKMLQQDGPNTLSLRSSDHDQEIERICGEMYRAGDLESMQKAAANLNDNKRDAQKRNSNIT